MLIIGCDYHPGFQQVAFVDTATGECGERRLNHTEGAEQFYRDLHARGMEVRIGMEASGHARWFERLISGLGFELWVGDAAEISTKRVRKHKNDRQDAELLLGCWWKIVSRGSGYRAARTVTCDNCCGIATAWCRRKPASGISYTRWR